MTPLTLVCSTGICPPETIEFLVQKGANVNIHGIDGESLLLSLAKQKKSDIAAILINNGVDVDEKDSDGNTAFDLALGEDDEILIKAVVDKFPERKEEVEKIYRGRLNCLIDFMKGLSTATEDDERWTIVPEVAAGIEKTKALMKEILDVDIDAEEKKE